ncbi:MAG TPA: hypothetical protein GX717_09920, partial [Clostridiaceae bacterium]|nr:hypothetical protein [Clostridiaceae bacterium]
TTVENTSKNNKGYFTSLSALNTAFPSPKAGQTAYVYNEASSTKYYIYNAVDGAWVATSIEAPSVGVDLAEYTKTGGSTKTTKEVEDEIVQLAGEVGLVKYTAGDNIIAELTNSEINDNNIWEDGLWSKNTGEESPSSTHIRTKNFYEIAGGVDFNYHFRLAGNAGVCFYDKDGNFINAIWNEAGLPSGIVEGSITTDEKARLFKVSHAKLSSLINIYLKPTETKTIATSKVFLRSDDLPEFKADGIIQEGEEKAVSGNTVYSAIAEFIKKTQDMNKIFLKGGQKQLINTENAVQLDLYLDTQGVAFSLGANLKFRGIKNGADYPIYFVDTTRKRAHSTNLYLGGSDAQINHVFLNVEDIDSVELFFDTNNPYELSVKTELHETYLEGREFNFMDYSEFNAISASKAKLMYGYKYYQIVDSVDCSDATFKQVPDVYDVTYAPLGYNILTKAGEKITGCTIAMHNNNIGITVVEDGYIYQPSGRAALVRPNASLNTKLTPEGSVIVSNSKVICRNAVDVKEVEREYNDFNLMRVPSSTLKKDAFNGSVIEWRDRSITYYINGYWGIKQFLQLHNVLDANDKIEQAFLIPFQRSLTDSTEGSALRIWLFTTAGKCYYNYATDGTIYYHHVNTWAESRIFNQFKNWVPVNDKSKATTYKKYFPVLSEYDYSQTNDISDPSTIYERPFTRLRNVVTPFHILTKNNIARLDHVTAFSNYCNQLGQEPFVMLTSDGGKTWYVKAYFAVTDQYYTGTHGGLVDFSPISDLNTYVANSLKVCRRRYNHPTAEIKEPSTRFTLVESESALVKSFSYDSSLQTMKMEVSEDIDWIDN